MKLKGVAKFKKKLTCGLATFVQSIQIFRWKSTEELCLKTLRIDVKFEEKLTRGSKNDMRNLVNFNASSDKFGNLHFDVLLLSIAYKFLALKSTEEWSLMTMKKDPHSEEKLTFYLKNDMMNLVNFNLSSGKPENLHFDGLLL